MEFLKLDVWLAIEENAYRRLLVGDKFEVKDAEELARYFLHSEAGNSREEFLDSWAFPIGDKRYFVFKPMFSKLSVESRLLDMLKGGVQSEPITIWSQEGVWVDEFFIVTPTNAEMFSAGDGLWMAVKRSDYRQFLSLGFVQRAFTQLGSDVCHLSQPGETSQGFMSRCCQFNEDCFVFGPFESKKALRVGLTAMFAHKKPTTIYVFGGRLAVKVVAHGVE